MAALDGLEASLGCRDFLIFALDLLVQWFAVASQQEDCKSNSVPGAFYVDFACLPFEDLLGASLSWSIDRHSLGAQRNTASPTKPYGSMYGWLNVSKQANRQTDYFI